MAITRLVSFAEERLKSGYTKSTAYIFTINYILGVGCLGIPYSFAKSGLMFGSVLIVFVSILAYMTTTYVAETVNRAQTLARLPCEIGSRCWLCVGPCKTIHVEENNNNNNNNANNANTAISNDKQPLLGNRMKGISFDKNSSSILCYDTNGDKSVKNNLSLNAIPKSPKSASKSSSASLFTPPTSSSSSSLTEKALRTSSSSSLNPQPSPPNSMDSRSRLRSDTMDSTDWSSTKSYEVTDLCKKFLSPYHVYIYQASLMGLMFIGLLAYSQVFGNSVIATISTSSSSFIDGDNALFYSSNPTLLSRSLLALVFSLVVIPLSLLELEEQMTVQALMAVLRFLAIFAMIFGSIAALFMDKIDNNSSEDATPPYFAAEEEGMSYLFNFNGFGVMFSTALFSQLFQHSVPGIIRPLPDHEKKSVNSIFASALTTTAALYLILGLTAASYFGKLTQSSVNLNFTDFYYGLDPDKAASWQLVVCSILSNLVVLFPALDTLSVFPLIAVTLGNNLATSSIARKLESKVNEHLRSRPGQARKERLSVLVKKDRKKKASSIVIVFWRIVASLPPIIVSIAATDLAFSLQLSGLAGLYVAFICPALLQIESTRSVTRCGLESNTMYSGWHSGLNWCYMVLVFSAFAFVIVGSQIWDAWKVLQGS